MHALGSELRYKLLRAQCTSHQHDSKSQHTFPLPHTMHTTAPECQAWAGHFVTLFGPLAVASMRSVAGCGCAGTSGPYTCCRHGTRTPLALTEEQAASAQPESMQASWKGKSLPLPPHHTIGGSGLHTGSLHPTLHCVCSFSPVQFSCWQASGIAMERHRMQHGRSRGGLGSPRGR